MGNKLDKMEGGQQSDNDAHLSSDNFSDSYIQFPDFETADQLSSPQPNPESHTQRSSEIDPSAALSDRRQVSRSQAPFPLSLPFGHAERAIPNRSTNRPIDPRLLQDSDHLSTSSTQSSTESFDSAKYIELFAKELSTRLEKVLLFQGRSGERVTDETFEELPTTPSAVQSSHEPSTGDKLGFWYSPYAASYYRELGTDEALASRPATPRAVHYPHEPLTDQNLGLCYSPYAGSSSQQLGTDEASTSRPTTPSTVHSSRELFTDGEDTSHETFLQEAIEALRLAYPESPDLAPSSYWWDEENSTHESHQINSPDLDMRRSSRLQNLAEAAINRGDREGLESNEASTLSATTMADDGMDDDEREDEEPEGSPSNKNSTREDTLEVDPDGGITPPTNNPRGWDFTIYEDPAEAAHLGQHAPQGEGFSFEEENKENLPLGAGEEEEDEGGGDDDLGSEIDWGEVEQLPRDAFGRPIARDGRPAIPERAPFGGRQSARRRARR